MKIKDLLKPNLMILDLKADSKEAAINEMIDKYVAEGVVTDRAKYLKEILDREAESTTGIGDGIAMPHAKTDAVNQAAVLFAKSSQGVDFNALDGQPVHLFFMIAAPEGANNAHLQALAKLSSLLINPDLVAKLKKAESADDVIKLFEEGKRRRMPKMLQTLRKKLLQRMRLLQLKKLQQPKNHLSLRFQLVLTELPTLTWRKQL